MKIVGRILIIMMAALVVVGVTFALVGSRTVTTVGRPQRDSAAQVQASSSSATGTQGGNVDFRGGRKHGNGASMSLFGLGEVGKDLAIIAVIVALVAPLNRWLTRTRNAAFRLLEREAA